ncbi:MAG TPA: hypothetical protein VJM11_19570, partial [Nevskiaceae bacterium]|nr:hypothetical protein [Nevskiaceae bacterium]
LDEPSLRAAHDALRKACQRHDAPVARRHVLAWGRAAWPQDPPQGVREVSKRIGDATLAPHLEALDRACYAGMAWNGDALASAFPSKPPAVAGGSRKATELAPLYP